MPATTTEKQPTLFEMAKAAEVKPDDAAKTGDEVTTDSAAADVVPDEVVGGVKDGVQEPVGDGDGQGRPSKEASVAHQFLEMLGYDVSDLSEEEIVAEAKRRFEKKQEPERTAKQEVEPKVDIASAASKEDAGDDAKAKDTAKQAESKRIAKLYCDPRLESLVEYNKAGKAIAREDTGEEGVAAAKQINEYMKAYRERLQRFGEDPLGFLEEGGLQDLIQKEIQTGIEKLEADRKKQAEQDTRQKMLMSEQQKVEQFFTDKEQEIFQVSKDGKPRFIGAEKQLSDFGKLLQEEYEELRKLAPTALDSDLLASAYQRMKKTAATVKTESKTVKEVAAEKQKRFLDKRTPPPSQERKASPPTLGEGAGKMSLRDLVAADPKNDDNPAVLKLRGSAQ